MCSDVSFSKTLVPKNRPKKRKGQIAGFLPHLVKVLKITGFHLDVVSRFLERYSQTARLQLTYRRKILFALQKNKKKSRIFRSNNKPFRHIRSPQILGIYKIFRKTPSLKSSIFIQRQPKGKVQMSRSGTPCPLKTSPVLGTDRKLIKNQ